MKLIPVQYRKPLCEGEVPKDYGMGADGQLYEIVHEPGDPVPDQFDGNVPETDKYKLRPTDEYYDIVTVCKACETEFIAYDENNKRVRNYCPGCGEKLI